MTGIQNSIPYSVYLLELFGTPIACTCGLTAFLSHRAVKLSRHLSIFPAIFSSFVVPAVLMVGKMSALDGVKVFSREYWVEGAKCTVLEMIPPFLGILTVACLIPSTVVVILYQWKNKGRRAYKNL